MRINKKTAIAGAVAVLAAAGGGILVSSSADAATTATTPIPSTQGSVVGWHIKDGTIYGADINPAVVKWFTQANNNTVTSASVKDGALGEADLNTALKAKVNAVGTGKQGPEGPAGPAGPAGPKGDTGISNLESDSPYPGATQLGDNPGNGANSTVKFVGKSNELQKAWVQCAEGKTAIGGGYQRADEGAAAFKNLQIVTSTPTQIKDGKEVYEPIAGDKAGSVKPNAWLVEGFNNGTEDLIVRPSVICADVN